MRRRCSLVLLLLLAGSPLLSRGTALAAEAPEVVLIRPADQRADSDRLWVALRAQLSGMPVRLVAHDVARLPARSGAQVDLGRTIASRRSALAVFWVDATLTGDSGTLHLFIAGKRRDRVLIRGVDARVDDRFEALALIARTAVRALLSGGTIGVELPPPASRFAGRVGYLFGAVASGGHMHHGVSLELAVRLGPLELSVGGAVASDVTASEQAASVETRAYPLWLALRWPLALRRGRFVLAPSLALGFDIADVDVETAPGFDSRSEGLHLGLYLAPSLVLSWRATRRVGLFIDAGAAIYLRLQRYVVASPSGTDVVALAPWRVQPLIRVGIVISII